MPTYNDMLDYEKYKHFEVLDGFMVRASGFQFYNTSKYTFETLLADPENIEANFRDYLAGFSANVQDVLAKFEFDNIIKRMVESNTLYLVIKEFNSPKGYLGPDKISAVDCGLMEDLTRDRHAAQQQRRYKDGREPFRQGLGHIVETSFHSREVCDPHCTILFAEK